MWDGLTMKPEYKQAWVAALRSGNFAKGKGYLRTIKKVRGKEKSYFCCHGVFSDINGRKCEYESNDEPETVAVYHYPGGVGDTYMPDIDWFGKFFDWDIKKTKSINKKSAVSSLADLLAGKNDGNTAKPQSLRKIADWIDKNL